MRQAKQIIEDKLDSEISDVITLGLVKETLQPFHGMKYDWRLIKKMVKALEDRGMRDVEFSAKYSSWTEVSFFKDDHPSESSQGQYRKDKGFQFMLWYDREATGLMRIDLLDERNTWASKGAPDRIKKLKSELRSRSKQQALDLAQNVSIPNLIESLQDLKELECFFEWRQNNKENIKTLIEMLGGRME